MADKEKISGSGGCAGCGLDSLVSIACVGGGAYLGYCHAKGLPVDPQVQKLIVYGPAAVGGVLGGIVGGLGFGIVGGAVGVMTKEEGSLKSKIGRGTLGAAGGGLVGTVLCGTISAALKEAQMAIGYGLGYLVGKLF